ncbi:carboxypeptidase M32 [Nitrogeniibacter mangrovi]|uniref:Metal-dependent carboxypeptidase n=1 Tax=Nitrogeniibacter mangrovi TaxID=2016596 RepID=A0A6C1B5Q9_9RHOO|nr:carboxypeptidase M32 [Nitrogeniibacter mangrovi]QID17574.1 carboxypeptidase M32 [Nitrogeniibacter mangrovi]
MSDKTAYTALVEAHRQLYRYEHLSAIVSWDRHTMMPPKGHAARAAAEGTLHAHIHRLRTDPRLVEWLEAAEQEPLDAVERADLREMRRDWIDANAVPAELVEARSLAASRCEHAWRTQRPANDWAGFLDNFRPLLRLVRDEACLLAERTGLDPYDALLERYEPGMRATHIDHLFGELKAWLPGLIARVCARQQQAAPIAPQGPFPVERQHALSLALLDLFGFDRAAGRLDVSAHPFTGGVAEDVRLTTRYDEADCLPALMATIHECGHARYNQNRPAEWAGRPIGRPRSFGIHESQSLFFELQLARTPALAARISPLLNAHLGPQRAFEPDNLHRLFTRVTPGKIRVAADEVTYPAHVILRYEIERALIEGDMAADDIPAAWDEKMAALLGVDTRGDYRNGCLQDVHWSKGSFGYFPCYTLGAMYAAQWAAALRRALPEADARIAAGDMAPAFDWLHTHVWSQASRWETDELARRASGEALDGRHLRVHLEARYLG